MEITLMAKRSAWLLFRRRKNRRGGIQRAASLKIGAVINSDDTACIADNTREAGSPALSAQAALSAAMAAAERPGWGPFGVFCDFCATMSPDEES